jgi:hypothetical protein
MLSRRCEQVCVVTLTVCVWCLCGCDPAGVVTLDMLITDSNTGDPAAGSTIALVDKFLTNGEETQRITDFGTTDAEGKIKIQYGIVLLPITLEPPVLPLFLLVGDGNEEESITFTIRDSIVEGERFNLQVLSVQTDRPVEGAVFEYLGTRRE